MKKVDLAKFLPCQRLLLPHFRRANYRCRQFNLSHVQRPEIPEPGPANGWSNSEGFLEPHWSDGPVLPENLNDLVMPDSETDSDDDDDMVSLDEGSCGDASECDSDID